MAIIYLFGDSITYGAWDVMDSGWASLVRRYFDEKQEKDESLYYLTYNLGIGGETTDGLVKRFEAETAVRTKEERGEKNVFVFAYGANDAAYIASKKGFRVSKERFKTNLIGVIEKARAISEKIILLNITPVVEAITSAQPYSKEKIRTNRYIKEYNAVLSVLAGESKIDLVDVYGAYMSAGYDKLFSDDGLHPNSAGHKVIFEKLMPFLEGIR